MGFFARWLCAVGLLSCSCQCEEPPKQEDQTARAAPYREWVKRLGEMARQGQSGKLQEQPCSERQLARLDGGDAPFLVAEASFLVGLAGRGADGGRFSWLVSPPLAKLPPLGTLGDRRSVTDALYAMKTLRDEYELLAVLATTRREPPRIEGGRFHAGQLDGWLVLFELESAQRLCQTELHAGSSPEVVGTEGQSQSEAVWKDFSLQVREAVEQGAERLGRGLDPLLGGSR